MASMFALFRAINLVKSVADADKNWTGTYNGQKIDVVEDVGFGGALWAQVKFKFAAGDEETHKLKGETKLFGRETIKLDDEDVEGDDLVISPHFEGDTLKRLVVEYKFRKDGADQRYVFENKIA